MNKKLPVFLASFLLFCAPVFALNTDVWLSSNTATADTTKNLCAGQPSTFGTHGNRGIIHGACINTGASGTLTIYNSSGTANSPIAAIGTTTEQPCSFYDVMLSSGLTYTNSATANVTLLYQCY